MSNYNYNNTNNRMPISPSVKLNMEDFPSIPRNDYSAQIEAARHTFKELYNRMVDLCEELNYAYGGHDDCPIDDDFHKVQYLIDECYKIFKYSGALSSLVKSDFTEGFEGATAEDSYYLILERVHGLDYTMKPVDKENIYMYAYAEELHEFIYQYMIWYTTYLKYPTQLRVAYAQVEYYHDFISAKENYRSAPRKEAPVDISYNNPSSYSNSNKEEQNEIVVDMPMSNKSSVVADTYMENPEDYKGEILKQETKTKSEYELPEGLDDIGLDFDDYEDTIKPISNKPQSKPNHTTPVSSFNDSNSTSNISDANTTTTKLNFIEPVHNTLIEEPVHNPSPQSKAEIKAELKNELREELKRELREELKSELRNELIKEITPFLQQSLTTLGNNFKTQANTAVRDFTKNLECMGISVLKEMKNPSSSAFSNPSFQ